MIDKPQRQTHILAYAGPMVALAIVNMLLISYLPNFYAAEIGISIGAVGSIFMAARAFDAIIDPVIGNWSDRTRSRWGRRKPWIAAAAPAFMVMTWLFFQPPKGIGVGYLAVVAMLFYVAYAAVIIPYMSWGAEIRRDYSGRTKINSVREGAGIVGTIIATILPVALLPMFVDGDPSLRQILELLAATIIVILAVAVPLALKVAPQGAFEPHPPLGLYTALGLLRANKPLMRILAAIFIVWLGGAFHNSTILFFVTDGLKLGRADFLWLVLAQYLMALCALPFWNRLAEKHGRHRALVLGAMGYFLAHQGFHLVPQGGFAGAIAVYIVAGFMTPVIWVMPPAIVADTVEYGMLKGGKDDAALYLALYAFVQKMALAIGVGLALGVAGVMGFDPKAPPTATGIQGLRIVSLILPGLIAAIGCIGIWNYPIDAKKHAVIRKWLARGRKAGGE